MMIEEAHHRSLLHSNDGGDDDDDDSTPSAATSFFYGVGGVPPRNDGEELLQESGRGSEVFQMGDLSGDEDGLKGVQEIATREKNKTRSNSFAANGAGETNVHQAHRPAHASSLCVVLILIHAFLQSYAWNGFVSILLIFELAPRLSLTAEAAVGTIHLFLCFTYLTSALGGFFTDIYPGKYKSMVIALILWVSGNLLIWIYDIVFLSDNDTPIHSSIFFIALVLTAFGRGIGTAANSSFLGDQLPVLSSAARIRTNRFNIFNCFIYVVGSGAVLGKFLSPWVRSHMEISQTVQHGTVMNEGSILALGVIFVALFFSHIALWCGYAYYVYLPVTPSRQNGMSIVWDILTRRQRHLSVQADDIVYMDDQEASILESIASLRRILFALIPLPIFWALFYQTSSSWILQATTLEGVPIFGSYNRYITPDQMQFVNPLLGLAFIPIGSYFVAPIVQRIRVILGFERNRRILSSTHRMIVGMLFISLSFFAAAGLQRRIDESIALNDTPRTGLSVMWQLPQYILLTTGEVLFCIAGMEFIYAEAPPTMKTAIQSCWYMTIAVGNLLAAILAFSGLFSFLPYTVTTPTKNNNGVLPNEQSVCSQYCMYITYALLMLVAIVVFGLIARKLFPNSTRSQRTRNNRVPPSSSL
eukprot:TRINITY_DN4059_c0_g1_i1.p1 TRINITY_DN4059_c0_g1~~TRINITY_DN4059_c0_g1_i1.p1  ORF type:complete len:652 (-),score=133.26 TRINITY_DN4059_c0_g1_i1:125-2056(-)